MSDKNTSKRKKRSSQEHPTPVDLRFLKVWDYIIQQNIEAKISPKSDSEICKMLEIDQAVISKIRGYDRGPSVEILDKVVNAFGIDGNCFYRDDVKIEYNPKRKADASYTATAGDQSTVIQNEGVIKGNIHTGDIDKVINQAEKLIINKFSPDDQETCMAIISDIKGEHTTIIEKLIKDSADELKKNADEWSRQLQEKDNLLRTVSKERDTVSKERDEERQKKEEYMEKLLDILQKNQK